jgi:hypothetical protein
MAKKHSKIFFSICRMGPEAMVWMGFEAGFADTSTG